MKLDTEIKELAEAWRADFGVADPSLAHEAVLAQGGPIVAGLPRAISIGSGKCT